MYPGNFYMPFPPNQIVNNPLLGSIPFNRNIPNAFFTRNGGIFGKLFNNIKGFNIGGFLKGANNTLNMVNQTIPLVRNTKPLFDNMKSVMKLARAFGNETYSSNKKNHSNEFVNKNNNIINNLKKDKVISRNNNSNNSNNNPVFFI